MVSLERKKNVVKRSNPGPKTIRRKVLWDRRNSETFFGAPGKREKSCVFFIDWFVHIIRHLHNWWRLSFSLLRPNVVDTKDAFFLWQTFSKFRGYARARTGPTWLWACFRINCLELGSLWVAVEVSHRLIMSSNLPGSALVTTNKHLQGLSKLMGFHKTRRAFRWIRPRYFRVVILFRTGFILNPGLWDQA